MEPLCSNCKANCPRDRHHSERVSTGSVDKPGEIERRYFACLVMHCGCKQFKAKTGDKKTGG